MLIHTFNTPYEITESSKNACCKLADAGICVSNQSVLLKDINDCPHVMKGTSAQIGSNQSKALLYIPV